MTRRLELLLAVAVVGLMACGGSGSSTPPPPPPPECTTHTDCVAGKYCSDAGACVALAAGTCRKVADCPAGDSCTANVCVVSTAECDKAANTAERARLVAAQPTFGVRSKMVKTFTTTFASLGGDPLVQCPVTLQFKDLNGDSALQPYEDWTLTADARAADLVGRMGASQKQALLLHPALADSPTPANSNVLAGTQSLITSGVRFGLVSATNSQLQPRATWANNVQEACEASALGVPFVISSGPAHSTGNGRVKARDFSQWPNELSLAAANDLAVLQTFGQVVSQEFRAIGIRMLLGPSANLATEPRWFLSQFTYGEDSAAVANRVEAFVKGAQGTTLGPTSLACVVNSFPGAGPAVDGWDAKLAKGKLVGYPGNAIDAHLAPFAKAFTAGVAGVMPAYGIPATGSWTGLGGLLNGATIEQVGASFNSKLLTDTLRTHYAYAGLVVAPWGVLDDAGISPLGAPWGVEGLTKAKRLAKAVNAGVDQFGGLADVTPVATARTAGDITDAQVDASARRALALAFRLGLFENPYVVPSQAPLLVNTDTSRNAGLDALSRGMVLVVNAAKPAGWLNHLGDGTQTGDKGNAGNGSLKVLPAPPGEPYVAAGCDYYIAGDFDLDYVRSVSQGYGNLTNDAPNVKGVVVTTAAQKMALSDYVFIRIAAPFTSDPDSGAYDYSLQSLQYGSNANAAALQPIADARAAITAWSGVPASQAQIIVSVDAGRPSVLSEILAYGPSGVYLQWSGIMPANILADKVFLDVTFGIVNGRGTLQVGLPLSDTAAASQVSDLAGDGQHATFVKGYGISTNAF